LKHIDELVEAHKRRRENEEEAARSQGAAAAKLAMKILKRAKADKVSRRQQLAEAEAAEEEEEREHRQAAGTVADVEREGESEAQREKERQQVLRQQQQQFGAGTGATAKRVHRRRRLSGGVQEEKLEFAVSAAAGPSVEERDGDSDGGGESAHAASATQAAHVERRKFRASYQDYLVMLTQQHKHAAEQQAEAKLKVEEVRAKLSRWVLKKAEKRRAKRLLAAQLCEGGDPSDEVLTSTPVSPTKQDKTPRRRKKVVAAGEGGDLSATTGALSSRLAQRFLHAADLALAHRGGTTTHRDGVSKPRASGGSSGTQGEGGAGVGGGSGSGIGATSEDMSRRIWRHKNRVPPGAKIFTMSGSYQDVRDSLTRRGWYENCDVASSCFDLKWCLKAADIHETALVSHQIVNHFSKAAAITTKCGLGRSLGNCSWFGNSDSLEFFPR
jgi:hypothetical protein